jgi:hypothetical protein
MRALFFLLIPVNLLFFLWAGGYLGDSSDKDALRAQQILPDNVRIVSRDEAPPLPVKPAQAKPEAPREASLPTSAPPPDKKTEICLALNDLQQQERTRIESLLAADFPDFSVEYLPASGKSTYWVFIPPRASRKEAEQKVEEIKRLNIPEFFIVQEGVYRFAISLGIFSTESAAMERLLSLQSKGVRSAIVGERGPRIRSITIRGPQARHTALRRALEIVASGKQALACQTPQ